MALKVVDEVMDGDRASSMACTKLYGIIPSRPSNLLALYQSASLNLLMIVRVSPCLKGRSYRQ